MIACSCIISKVSDDLISKPSLIVILECLREIPMIEGYKRSDTICKQHINPLVVMFNTFFVQTTFTCSIWQNSRPWKWKSIIFDSHWNDIVQITIHLVVWITSNISIIAIVDITSCRVVWIFLMSPNVPNIFSFLSFINATFNLISCSCKGPSEVFWEISTGEIVSIWIVSTDCWIVLIFLIQWKIILRSNTC